MIIRRQIVNGLHNTGGTGNKKKYITYHETDNFAAGATAAAHANLQSNGYTSASWHWTVDDKEAVQSFNHHVICWHAGDGKNGIGNTQSIAVEVCVNKGNNREQTKKNAAELIARIAKDEGIPLSNIVQHKRWSGKNCPSVLISEGGWNAFINQVRSIMGGSTGSVTQPNVGTGGKSITTLAQEVIDGKHGNGDARRKSLGANYNAVQVEVNRLLGGGSVSKPAVSKPAQKSITTLAKEVIDGKHGNGDARRKSLGANYNAVQAEVNRLLK